MNEFTPAACRLQPSTNAECSHRSERSTWWPTDRPIDRFLDALATVGCEAKQSGDGWSARCPAHNDRQPSLSIAEGDDGRVLVNCFKGCDCSKICSAVGLKLSDLMPDSLTTSRDVSHDKKSRNVFSDPAAALSTLESKLGRHSAIWIYHDLSGNEVGQIVRWNRGDKGKEIRPISKNGEGWYIGGMPAPRPLYRLPDLVAASRVYITEGEKAAEVARSLGVVATTSPHGSKSAKQADWSHLAAKECVILPDHDSAGISYAETVAGQLHTLTPRPRVKILELPELGEGEDIAEWVANQKSKSKEDLKQELEAMADQTQEVTGNAKPVRRAKLVCMADVKARPIDWLWPQRIALGRISLLVGMPGAGKSFLTCDMASRVSTGSSWPDGQLVRLAL